VAVAVDTPGGQAVQERRRQGAANPRIIKVKKMPIESTWAEELKVAAMPAPAPRWFGRKAVL